MQTLKQKLLTLNRKNKKLQKKLAEQHKLKRRLYQRQHQQTRPPCDRYWFPHRYEFGKCKAWDIWDKIAIELGAISKKIGGKCPF